MTALVLLAFAGLAVVFSRWPTRHGIRESLLRAALVFGAIVMVATEVLSLYGQIKASNVLVLWLVLAVAAWIAAIIVTRFWLGVDVGIGMFVIGLWSKFAGTDSNLMTTKTRSTFPLVLTTVCSIFLALTFLIGVVAPPNFPDALTYHMTRVAQWIQAGNVDYFLTSNTRQNYQKPFAEFVILHLQLLSGGDRWANLVQWAAYALSGVTVSLILAELRQSPRVQGAGALIVYATPMAILEASGAQNDLVVALWLLAFLFYLQRGLSDRSLESAVLCGLALGLALATKGTAYLYAPAMAATFLVARFMRAPRWRELPPIGNMVAAMLVAGCLNLGPWLRSVSVYGTPVCCTEGYFVDRLTPGDAVSNLVRNTTLHLGIPKLTEVVNSAAEILSPVDLSDPATTFGRNKFRVSFSTHEGTAGNTLLLFAFVGSVIAIAADRRLRRGSGPAWVAAALAGFLVFSLALRWQPPGSRLHTPVFLVAAVPVAIALGVHSPRIQNLVLAVFFSAALPYLLINRSRPLLPLWHPSILVTPRDHQYFVDRPWFEAASSKAGSFIRRSGEPEVGLLMGPSDYEYPLWIAFKKDFTKPPLVRHVGVSDAPRVLLEPALPPPATVVTSRAGERHTVDGVEYVRVRDFGELSILRRGEP